MGVPTDAGSAPGRGMARWLPAAGMGACPAHPDSPAEPRPAGETPAGARRCQRWTLTVVCLASALLLFNVTAPNVALPAIAADLGADFAAQQWVLSAYALVLASLLLAGGALGDRYGRRRAFLLGLAVFGLGSLGCALAPSPALLIAGRVLQGLGAAALFPSGLALIAAEFTGAARARAIGVWGACVSGAIALGPLIGGLLVQVSGWRAEFVFAVVLVVPAAAVGLRHLRESRDRSSARLDWAGTGLLTGALVLLIVLVQRGSAIGWGSPVTHRHGRGVRGAVRRVRAGGVPDRGTVDRSGADAQPDLRRRHGDRAGLRRGRVRPAGVRDAVPAPGRRLGTDAGRVAGRTVRGGLAGGVAAGGPGGRADRGAGHPGRRAGCCAGPAWVCCSCSLRTRAASRCCPGCWCSASARDWSTRR